MEKHATGDAVTRKDLLDLEDRLTKKLATKEELKQEVAKLVTKEELKQEVAKLATKKELKKEVATLATKEELKQEVAKLATREALEVVANQVMKNTNDIDNIKTEIKAINYKIDRLDEKLDYKFNMVLDAVDTVLKEITDNRIEKVAYDHALSRHDMRFEDHEKRIQALESKAA